MCWARPKEYLYWFWSQNVKVIFGLWIFYRFRSITQFPIGIQWWYFIHVLTMAQDGPLHFGTKRSKSYLDSVFFLPFPHVNSISFRHKHVFTMTRGGPPLILGSEDQRSRSYFDFFMSQGGPFLILGFKRLRLYWKSLNSLPRGFGKLSYFTLWPWHCSLTHVWKT